VDDHDIRRRRSDGAAVLSRFAAALSNQEATTTLIGVDLDNVSGFRPDDRRGAWRRSVVASDDPQYPMASVNEAFTARIGALDTGDAYFYLWSNPCAAAEADLSRDTTTVATAFVRMAAHTPLFITNAVYDRAIYAPAIVKALDKLQRAPVIDEAPRAGAPRPGWFTFDLYDDDGSVRRTEVRFPKYEAGHAVAETAGAALIDDIASWFREHEVERH
jgi:hypothetical protein